MSRCVCVRRAKHANMSRRTCVSEFQRYYVGIGGRGGGVVGRVIGSHF